MLSGKKIALINMWPGKYFDIYSRHLAGRNSVQPCVPHSEAEMDQVSEWADIAWMTFTNQGTVYLSEKGAQDHLITSLRVYEMMPESGFIPAVRWENVDGLHYESTHIERLTKQMYGGIDQVNSRMIWDCIYLDEYPFTVRERGYDIAYLGYINSKKGWDRVLYAMHTAVSLDPRYKLHVAGVFQETRWEIYIRHMIAHLGLVEHIEFYGWVRDISEFLSDKHYLLSCSQWEGCPKGIIEAMACGVKPLIHHFVGASEVFPVDTLWCSLEDFETVLTGSYEPDAYRNYVEEKFNASIQMPLLEQFIEESIA